MGLLQGSDDEEQWVQQSIYYIAKCLLHPVVEHLVRAGLDSVSLLVTRWPENRAPSGVE